MDAAALNEMVRVLNELCGADRQAMGQLVNHRIPCNEKLADHPTCQVVGSSICRVGPDYVVKTDYKVGLMGVLNAVVGARTDGGGFICAVYDDDREFLRFGLTDGKGGVK